MAESTVFEKSVSAATDAQELIRSFRGLEEFLGRAPERADTVKVPWETPLLEQFIDLAVREKLWLVADHLLAETARRGPLSPERSGLAARVRNLKATMFVQVSQLPPDAPMALAIEKYVRELKPRVILDVGAATGLGTTAAFSRAAQAAGIECTIHAMESEPATFELLRQNAAGWSKVRPVFSALITDEDVPSWGSVLAEIAHRSTLLENYPADEMRAWYDHGVAQLRKLRLDGKAPWAELPERIDLAMIDADLFFARQELAVILNRTNVVMLDDVCGFKNAWNHEMLSASEAWEKLDYQPKDRHGWSAFRRK